MISMKRPRICVVLVDSDLKPLKEVEPLVDLFEVRIDLIGDGWQELVGQLEKPWIACNRSADEGGSWRRSESKRREELLKAIELGADIVDIELVTGNLREIVQMIKKKAKCLLSFHDLKGMPPLNRMREIVQRELETGADICKVIGTARRFEDNLTILQLVSEFREARIVSFAMGGLGLISRILCPLVGADFTYASIEKGKESAAGQMAVRDLRKLYEMVQ